MLRASQNRPNMPVGILVVRPTKGARDTGYDSGRQASRCRDNSPPSAVSCATVSVARLARALPPRRPLRPASRYLIALLRAGAPVASTFDHDRPILFEDQTDDFLNACGQRVKAVQRAHRLRLDDADGTPLLAVADGRIVRAEQESVTCRRRPGPGAKVVVIETRPNTTDVSAPVMVISTGLTSPSAILFARAMSSAHRATQAAARAAPSFSGRANA